MREMGKSNGKQANNEQEHPFQTFKMSRDQRKNWDKMEESTGRDAARHKQIQREWRTRVNEQTRIPVGEKAV
jgi:hypothetical protein